MESPLDGIASYEIRFAGMFCQQAFTSLHSAELALAILRRTSSYAVHVARGTPVRVSKCGSPSWFNSTNISFQPKENSARSSHRDKKIHHVLLLCSFGASICYYIYLLDEKGFEISRDMYVESIPLSNAIYLHRQERSFLTWPEIP